MATICKFNQIGFCKFLSYCRNMHINEKCSEIKCEDRNCLKRHPKICKFYQLYNRCKFGEYCAFTHKENAQVTEMKELKNKCATMDYDLNEKGNEILDLKVKLEVLEEVVKQVVRRVEGITTPTKEGTKKRRRVKQTLTPSPTPRSNTDHEHVEEELGQRSHTQTDQDTDPSDRELTAEEILALYDSGQEQE